MSTCPHCSYMLTSAVAKTYCTDWRRKTPNYNYGGIYYFDESLQSIIKDFGKLKHGLTFLEGLSMRRLRVVSIFGDGDCGAGEIHTRAREISRRRDGSPPLASPRNFARARVCIFRPPHNRDRQN